MYTYTKISKACIVTIKLIYILFIFIYILVSGVDVRCRNDELDCFSLCFICI